MNDRTRKLRAQIIEQALDARSEEDIANAICQLDRWLKENPDDMAIRDAYEPLMLRQSVNQQPGGSAIRFLLEEGREVTAS